MDFTENLDQNFFWQIDEHCPFAYYLWEPQQTFVVLGRSNIAEGEVYVNRCNRDNVHITKRRGGGGAVVLTKGMLIISIAKLVKNSLNPLKWFRQINALIIEVLKSNQVQNLSQRGISDICIGARKILGGSLYLPRGRLFYQASLLVYCDLTIIEKYLKHPSREPDYRNGRSHRDFLTTLWLEGYTISIDNLKKSLERILHDDLRAIA